MKWRVWLVVFSFMITVGIGLWWLGRSEITSLQEFQVFPMQTKTYVDGCEVLVLIPVLGRIGCEPLTTKPRWS